MVKMYELPYAEDIGTSWKTNSTAPGAWLDKIKKEIERFGGSVGIIATGTDPISGRDAFLIIFEIEGDRFKVVWPVLPTRKKQDEKSAQIQAASLLHHDIKAKCVSAKVVGARAAFFSYLLLPDGRSAVEASVPELQNDIPSLFNAPQIEQGGE
jgi:hypothetical protein